MIVIKDVFTGNFKISQKFGARPEVYKQFQLRGHNGIDWALPNGQDLVCCFRVAQVIQVHDDGNGYGKHIKLWDKGQNCVALYGHLREPLVKEGDTVYFGQLIGISNNTGFSTGPHLHFGVLKVDDNCKRLNTDNGYKGWINPFDGRIFKWEVENITKPIKHGDSLQECRSELGTYKNMLATSQDLVKSLEKDKGIIEVKLGEMEEMVADWQSSVSTANKTIKKTEEKLEAMQGERNQFKKWYEASQEKNADKLNSWQLFKLLVNKLFPQYETFKKS